VIDDPVASRARERCSPGTLRRHDIPDFASLNPGYLLLSPRSGMRSAQILWEALMTLTRKQQRLRTEIEDISSIIWMDHWHIEKYPPKGRTDLLIVMKDKLVRGEVITKYAVIDELLTMIICNYYFHKSKRELTYRRLWKTRRFAIFNHYIMDEVYLLKNNEYRGLNENNSKRGHENYCPN
jgi:hypothetical protein